MVVTVACRLKLRRPKVALAGGLLTKAASFRNLFPAQLNQAPPGVALARNRFAWEFGPVMPGYRPAQGARPTRASRERLRAHSTSLCPAS